MEDQRSRHENRNWDPTRLSQQKIHFGRTRHQRRALE